MAGDKIVHGILDPKTGPVLLNVPLSIGVAQSGDVILWGGMTYWSQPDDNRLALKKDGDHWVPMSEAEVITFVRKAAPGHFADFDLYSRGPNDWYVAVRRWGDEDYEFWGGEETPGLVVLKALGHDGSVRQ